MKTLQEMLHARAGGEDSRAANAVIDVRAGRVRILLGDVGGHRRVVLGVEGNDVRILLPTDLASAEAAPVHAVIRDGKLFAGEGGPEILPPEGWDPFAVGKPPAGSEADSSASGTQTGEPEGSEPADDEEQEGDGAGGKPAVVIATEHTKDELLAIAQAEGLDLKANTSKADIAAAINEKRAAGPQ